VWYSLFQLSFKKLSLDLLKKIKKYNSQIVQENKSSEKRNYILLAVWMKNKKD
jgi:hypothetical protein